MTPRLPVLELQGYSGCRERNNPEARKILEMVRYKRVAERINIQEP